jgi:Protein of unknown function (DUF2721)
MSHEILVRTINLIIAPVVMLTTCGIMLNGLLVRYTWLSDRVRSVHQERLSLVDLDLNQHRSKGDQLHHLLPDLLRHHHQVHDVLVLIYLSILIFMLDMLVIALATVNDVGWLHQLVVIVFLVGISILLGGMVLIAYELRTSHHSTQLEVHQNCQLCSKSHQGGR